MKKLILVLLTVITLTACSSDKSSVALEREKNYKSFEDWCLEKSTLPEDTRITIEILLKKVETQDCKKANRKLNELTRLQLSSYNQADTNKIGDLKVLSSLTNLRKLDIFRFKLDNKHLRQISSLTHLTKLGLFENKINDIKPLSNLINLRELFIGNDKISDIKPLSNLNNLKDLRLSGTQISDIKPISNLTNLTRLNLRVNQISDIQSLSSLTNLQSLFLKGNPINDKTCPPEIDSACDFN